MKHWKISIYLLKFHKFIKIPKIYEFLLRIQAIIFFGVVLYGIVTLTSGVINSKLRDQVLEQNAMGYKFFKWVNFNLKNDNSPIIVFDRSISLSKNFVISRDHLFFVNLSKPEAKEYVEEIKKIIKIVEPKIVILLFFVKDPRAEVISDFSVSLRPISFSVESKFINVGNSKNVTNNETINPKVIIQPKSIIGFIPLKTKDRNAHMVVRTV